MIAISTFAFALALLVPVCAYRRDAEYAQVLKLNDTADTEANQSQAIVIFMAMNAARSGGRRGGFSGGYSGGGYRYSRPPPPQPPKWTRMPLGCERTFNKGYCELTLLQSACVARHGELAGITAADACQKMWPGEMKKQPRHMYCLAAAADPGLQELAQGLKELAPQDSSKCAVDSLSHFKKQSGSSRSLYKTPEKRLQAAGSYALFGDDVDSDLGLQIRRACGDYVSKSSEALSNGFCHKGSGPGQDCGFLWGIRAGWDANYGKNYCDALTAPAGQLRCLALRKQIIRVAQAKSFFGTVRWTKFDEVVRISRKSCPQPPEDVPGEPEEKDGVEDAERVDEEDPGED